MLLTRLTALGLAAALAIGGGTEARSDAGDFIGGAIVGGVLGHAIAKDQQRRRTVVTRTYRPRIPVTQHGTQTQSALNYFGFNAGRVDGQIGPGTRRAIEAYQLSMGYPVNGHNFPQYQFDGLMQAYYWGQNGGQMQTGLVGQPLLAAYRRQMQTGSRHYATAPMAVAPAPTTTVVVAAPSTTTAPPPPPATVVAAKEPENKALPNLFAGGSAPAMSLANRCNVVMLQTSTNGGYTTLASMSDPDFTLSEQFCLARSYAIARGEELMQGIPGMTPQMIVQQCGAFGDMLSRQVDAISLAPQRDAEAQMRDFALGTGIPPADLAATSRVCLSVGYSQDDMQMALGSALMLVTLGEPAFGELLGHHLREGFGTAQRRDLAMQWYQASLTALENGADPVFMPSQTDRPVLLQEAAARLGPTDKPGLMNGSGSGTTAASLPTFNLKN